jgi:hypothetical protein
MNAVYRHQLPSGAFLYATFAEPGGIPCFVVTGQPGPGESAEANHWIETVIRPALAERTLEQFLACIFE